MLHIKDATVYTMEKEGIIENCDILIENGKIKEVGTGLVSDQHAQVIDAKGLIVIPGIVVM